ncbi:hypothetical protein AEM42_04800 [Betaproteobacteria bacterium UKL13-2]|nr:hypothetical protein AEM42_04800 [Betaproteobacteria bacterium UKL13-2]HCG53867.1 hypothetical protein [Betaproteobacteria bacterium]
MSLTPLRSLMVSQTVALGIAVFSTVSFVQNAAAHDAWVAPVAGSVYPVHFGHKEPQSYAAAKVKAVSVFDAKRATLTNEISRDDKGASVKVSGTPAMFLVEFDNGSYSTVDGKTVNVGKREAPSATSSRRPLKWGKTIVVWQSWMTEPVGQRIEVLPVTAAAEPTAGSKFTVRVLFEGKPLAGVMVENNSNETGPKTDADGRATLVLVPGINRLAVDYDLPLKADADADTLALNASLVFMAR